MEGSIPGVNNSRGNWFYQTERNKMPMDDVSPEQAATFFHTVEINLNQTTTVLGWVPNTAKVHAIDSKPKTKPKAKAASSPERVKSSSTPSTPLRTEGPAPPRQANTTPTPKENPGKGRGKNDPDRQARLQPAKRVSSVFGSIEGTVPEGNHVSMAIFLVQMGSL